MVAALKAYHYADHFRLGSVKITPVARGMESCWERSRIDVGKKLQLDSAMGSEIDECNARPAFALSKHLLALSYHPVPNLDTLAPPIAACPRQRFVSKRGNIDPSGFFLPRGTQFTIRAHGHSVVLGHPCSTGIRLSANDRGLSLRSFVADGIPPVMEGTPPGPPVL